MNIRVLDNGVNLIHALCKIEANGIDDYILLPGIMVEVYILTGERTVLSYITSPFHNSLGQALQER